MMMTNHSNKQQAVTAHPTSGSPSVGTNGYHHHYSDRSPGTEAYPVEYKSQYTIRTVESEQEIQKKSSQLKKLAKAFYVLQQEKKRVDEYCLMLETQNIQLKEEVQQQKLMMDAKDKKIARQHEKLMEKEEGYLERLEDQVADLTIQRDTHWLPQLKHNQRQRNLLEKKNIILKKQLKEVRAELTSTKAKLQEALECTDKDKLLEQIKTLETENEVMHKDLKQMQAKLLAKTNLCKSQAQTITELKEQNEKLEVDLNRKTMWNNQTQLYFSEKRDMVGQLKRETGVLGRQLRRETKRGLKRETVLHTLINENREIRKQHEVQYLTPVTIVQHDTDAVFYDSVKAQLTDMVRELELDKPTTLQLHQQREQLQQQLQRQQQHTQQQQLQHHQHLQPSPQQSPQQTPDSQQQSIRSDPSSINSSGASPSISSISSTDHVERLQADINRLNRSVNVSQEQLELRQRNNELVSKFVLFHEELNNPPSTSMSGALNRASPHVTSPPPPPPPAASTMSANNNSVGNNSNNTSNNHHHHLSAPATPTANIRTSDPDLRKSPSTV